MRAALDRARDLIDEARALETGDWPNLRDYGLDRRDEYEAARSAYNRRIMDLYERAARLRRDERARRAGARP